MAEPTKTEAFAATAQFLKGKKILVVDDTVDNQILEKMYLMSAGAHVDLADNGIEGIQKALQDNYDAILMDLHMPEVDGFIATRQLRKSGFIKPIIAVTANSLPETKYIALTSGFSDFLTKPLSRRTLLETIDQVFAKIELDALRKNLIAIAQNRNTQH